MNSKVMFMEVFDTVINEKPKMLYNKYPSYKKSTMVLDWACLKALLWFTL